MTRFFLEQLQTGSVIIAPNSTVLTLPDRPPAISPTRDFFPGLQVDWCNSEIWSATKCLMSTVESGHYRAVGVGRIMPDEIRPGNALRHPKRGEPLSPTIWKCSALIVQFGQHGDWPFQPSEAGPRVIMIS